MANLVHWSNVRAFTSLLPDSGFHTHIQGCNSGTEKPLLQFHPRWHRRGLANSSRLKVLANQSEAIYIFKCKSAPAKSARRIVQSSGRKKRTKVMIIFF